MPPLVTRTMNGPDRPSKESFERPNSLSPKCLMIFYKLRESFLAFCCHRVPELNAGSAGSKSPSALFLIGRPSSRDNLTLNSVVISEEISLESWSVTLDICSLGFWELGDMPYIRVLPPWLSFSRTEYIV
ncbi:hypothetical protein PM082_001204 [Marasmius tenuissimus]|nr:hypothetical protein PM082_001204 [Marasmius tenuissimus]